MPAVETKETRHPRFALQPWPIDIQRPPVNALQRQGDMRAPNLGHAACYAHLRLRLAPVLRDQMPALCGHMTETDSSVSLPNRSRLILCPVPATIQLVGLRRSLVRNSL